MTTKRSEIQMVRIAGRQAWHRAWQLAAVQVLATAAGFAALKLLPPKYRSSTTIRVERGQIINPLTRGLAVSSEMEARIRGIREEILSRDYFDKIITRLRLEPPGTPAIEHEDRLLEMIESTQITTSAREGDTFQIEYVGRDPRQVRDVTNLLAGIFIEESLANKAGEAGSAVDFLQQQLDIYKQKLEESEGALRRFEEKHPEQLPASRAAQIARVEQLRGTVLEVQNSLRQAEIQRDLLRGQLPVEGAGEPESAGAGAPLMVPNPLHAELQEKRARLRRLLVDYSESYPDVAALRAEIARLEEEVAATPTVPASESRQSQPTTVRDALGIGQLQQLEVQIHALTTRLEQLERELERSERKLRGIPEVEQELARLKRDYDVNNDIYNSFLRRLEEARVTRELESSKKGEVFRILEAASLPLKPFRPLPHQAAAAGVGLGLVLNAALLYLLALRDSSFQSVPDVKAALGLKVLAGIPIHRSPRDRRQRALKGVGLSLAAAAYAATLAFWLAGDEITRFVRSFAG